MGIDAKVNKSGLKSLQNRLKTADTIVRKAAFDVEANAKMAIQTGTKTGRVYAKKGTARHQASASGEAPATDTGALVNSIHATRESEAEWQVAASAEYAIPLELARNRPFLLPALMAVKASFIAAVQKLFED